MSLHRLHPSPEDMVLPVLCPDSGIQRLGVGDRAWTSTAIPTTSAPGPIPQVDNETSPAATSSPPHNRGLIAKPRIVFLCGWPGWLEISGEEIGERFSLAVHLFAYFS